MPLFNGFDIDSVFYLCNDIVSGIPINDRFDLSSVLGITLVFGFN